MTTMIAVDPTAYQSASSVFGTAIGPWLSGAAQKLEAAFEASPAMAGTDCSGTKWAAVYDPAAGQTASAIRTACTASFSLANLLAKTGLNHAGADAASVPGGAPAPTSTTYSGGPPVSCALPSDSSGSSTSAPDGWDYVASRLPLGWPDGDPTQLRATALAWQDAHVTCQDAADSIDSAISAIDEQLSPEVEDAVRVCSMVKTQLTAIAGNCDALAATCTEFAANIENAQAGIRSRLVHLVETLAVSTGIGLGLTLLTVGISDAIAGGADATAIGLAAVDVGETLATLSSAATNVADGVTTTEAAAADAEAAMQPIAEAETVDAATTTVEAVPDPLPVDQSEMQGLVRHLEADEEPEPQTLDRADLSDDQAANFDRYVKKLPAGARKSMIMKEEDGSVQFSSDVPGRVPGSYAKYTKVVDSAGRTVRYYKTTIDPNGAIVHVKIKFP